MCINNVLVGVCIYIYAHVDYVSIYKYIRIYIYNIYSYNNIDNLIIQYLVNTGSHKSL